jgi:hypothetical protein
VCCFQPPEFSAEQNQKPATDASPGLVQPSITTQKAFAFAPFTIEVGQDWQGLETELGRLMNDAKNVLESSKFLTGTGTNEPGGILNIGGTGGLTTTQRVQTAVSATYAVGDPWLLKAALPPRFIPTTTYAAGPAIWDKTYRFVARGSTTEPRQFSDGDRGGDFLGAPKVEWSSFVVTTTTGSRIMVAGDFNTGYLIADRIGGTIEIIPHLFGAAQALRKINAAAIVGTVGRPDNWWRCGRARKTVAADGTDSQRRRSHHHWLSELSPRGRRTDAHHAALPGSFVAEPALAISGSAVPLVGFAARVHGARAPSHRLHRPTLTQDGGSPEAARSLDPRESGFPSPGRVDPGGGASAATRASTHGKNWG